MLFKDVFGHQLPILSIFVGIGALRYTFTHDYKCLAHRILSRFLESTHSLHELLNQLGMHTERFGDGVTSLSTYLTNLSDLVLAHGEKLPNEILLEDKRLYQ